MEPFSLRFKGLKTLFFNYAQMGDNIPFLIK